MNAASHFLDTLTQHGLVAILRGLSPADAVGVGDALYEAGFRLIEVPLNSPEPLRSIRLLRDRLPADALIGAGTVLKPSHCAEIAEAGGQLVVMPHADTAVIRAAKAAGLICAPGVATLTEAFAALAAGADALKMFPAEVLGTTALKAWRAVLPSGVALVPVGGVTPQTVASYVAAGAAGLGLGSALYRPGDTPLTVTRQASAFIEAWKTARSST